MPAFRYKALGRTGAIDTGLLTAKDVAAAQRQLRAQQLTPLSVTPSTESVQMASNVGEQAIPLPDAETARTLLGKIGSSKPRAKRKIALTERMS